MDPVNRREFLRAEVRLPAACRILDHEEVEKVKAGRAGSLFHGRGNPSLMDEMIQQATPGLELEPLYRCMQLLNNKLDFLIDQFSFTGAERNRTINEVIEISGSGLKFTSLEPLPAGTLLKIDLILPVSVQFRVELIAEVVRSEKTAGEEARLKPGCTIIARFAEIDEESRDSIIKTVFKALRKVIRMERNG